MRTFKLIIIALILNGCSHSEPPKQFTPYKVDELLVPGRMGDAKATGFTQCEASSYSYRCFRDPSKAIFGVQPSDVSVSLNGDNHFSQKYEPPSQGDVRELDPNKLSYGEIEIEFSKEVFDEDCVKKNKLDADKFSECFEVKGVEVFMSNLRKAGWIEVHSRLDRYYFYKDVPIKITARPAWNKATIAPATTETVAGYFAEIAQREADEKRRKAQADAVIQQMKN